MKTAVLFVGALMCVASGASAQDEYHDAVAPLPPLEAARSMQVPPGFEVTLFAGEPDVMQPIGFCIDDRGRLWVAEAYNYPKHGEGVGDRIIILEDSNGDGRHDKRTVFFDGLNYVTGIEVGFGGAWIMSPPNFYFIPDRDGDDLPDSQPEVVLDGFGNHANAHNLANGFAWGPDGWLYGTHGRTNWSLIGKPGTPTSERVQFDGGVYRYHPVTKVWEAYADGTTNPWGIDWNDFGHAFVCNCVNPHLFQVIQGAHYEPWRGRESSQYAYQRIDTIADHLHFVGLSNVRRGLGSADEDTAGGGHAHCGTMIYLGDNLPDSYRNTLFTNNIHGRRINNDIPRRSGSGYVASHGPDLLRSQDPWFMGVTLAYGPGGEIYVSDWSDTGECHSTRNTRRETGRIYRLKYGSKQSEPVDLRRLSDQELVELQLHKNDWYVRHARRLLQERTAAGKDMAPINASLRQMFSAQRDIPRKLRAMWALNVTGGLDGEFLIAALQNDSEDVRAWAVTLLLEHGMPATPAMERLVELAARDNSPLVRLSLASGLQRLALPQRWELATALAARAEDQTDQNLPLMIWYGCEALIEVDLPRFAELGSSASISQVRINVARRIASFRRAEEGLDLLTEYLSQSSDDEIARDVLTGILQGVEGQRSIPMPASWRAAYERLARSDDAAVRDLSVRLAVVFNDQTSLDSLRRLALDPNASDVDRSRAIDALVAKKMEGFDADLLRLVEDHAVSSSVLRGLAAYNLPRTPEAILRHYETLRPSDKQLALLTLAARENWALALLAAVESKRLPASDISAFTARQIRELGNADISLKLASLWGEVRETPQEKAMQIESIKKWLTADVLSEANPEYGQQLFSRQCANCHQFFGEGGKIGPDITGSQRTNLDYMLENIIDPSASVARDYQMEVLQTVDGRTLTGLIESESDGLIALQTVSERLVIPSDEIAARKKSNVSIMPQGLLEPLSDEEIRDLFGYLQR